MKRSFLLLFVLIITINLFAQKTWQDSEITKKDVKAHIFYLASENMKGRFTGSDEERLAGDYLKERFQTYGLKPAFGSSYFQEFPFIEKLELTKNNSLTLINSGNEIFLKPGDDFITAPFSGNSRVVGNAVFVGYGVSAPRLNYDDYEGIDVKGKVVIAMRYHPEHDSSKSSFDMYSTYRQKAALARDKGAAAIIFVNGFLPKNDEDLLMNLRYDGAPAMQNFSVLQIKRSSVDQIFKDAKLDFADYQKRIDQSKQPMVIEIENLLIDIETEIQAVEKTARNVAGILEGNDEQFKNEYIVIGAHYDHLGIDQLLTSSMYKGNEKVIHFGADDNASGTAGVMELAEKFASMKDQLKRSFIFIAFSGEELGLLGSSYFVNNPPIPLENIITMLNMDMVGRLNSESNLTVIGAGTSSTWKNLLEEKNNYELKLSLSESGSGGSDHQVFYNKNIPVLFFFTGTHEDYHRPTDVAEQINYEGQEKVLNYVFEIADAVNQIESKPDYVKVAEPTNRGMGRSRVTVGTVPEFAYNGKGYKLSGVTEGSAAAIAGLQAGDIIIKFGSKTVDNIYDFMYATQEYKPGDSAEVVILRDEKELKFTLELKAK